ncbi:MAG: glycosyltransferase [Flavobacteriales bacterium]
MAEQLSWILVTITALLLVAQLFTMLSAFKHLLEHDELPSATTASLPFISTIVPARNEAGNIAALLQDLLQQDYPADRSEVIVVDDGSDDATLEIAGRSAQPCLRVLPLPNATGKKAAIEFGVEHANGDLILVTDADARCGRSRLMSIAQAWHRTKFDMLLMPIAVRTDGSLLQELQANEQSGFMAVAIASARAGTPLIANGANMAFRRSVFEALSGYDGNRHIASGDDMFLLEKMRGANKTVASLAVAAAVVNVPAATTWRSFLDQRLRWAGKMRSTGFGMMSLLPALALLLPVLLWGSTFNHFVPFGLALVLWCAWLIPLVVLISSMNDTLGRRPAPLSLVMHLMLFSLYAPAVAMLSAFHRPGWKGRSTRPAPEQYPAEVSGHRP